MAEERQFIDPESVSARQFIDPDTGGEKSARQFVKPAKDVSPTAIAPELLKAPEPEPLKGKISFDVLKRALIGAESGWNPNARSPKDARGLMQVIPATGSMMAERLGIPYDEQLLSHDADYNETIGSAYLKEQWDKYGEIPAMAAAAYNAGPGGMDKALAESAKSGKHWVEHLPGETKKYLHDILQRIHKITGEAPDISKAGRAAVQEVKLGIQALPATAKTLGRELLYGKAPEVTPETWDNPTLAALVGPSDKPTTALQVAREEQDKVADLQGKMPEVDVQQPEEEEKEAEEISFARALQAASTPVFPPHQLEGAPPEIQEQYEDDRAEMLDFVRRKEALGQALTPAEREIKGVLSGAFMVGAAATGIPLAGVSALASVMVPSAGMSLAEKRASGKSPVQALGETGVEQGLQMAPIGFAGKTAAKGAGLVKQMVDTGLAFGGGRAATTAYERRNEGTPLGELAKEFAIGGAEGAVVGAGARGIGKIRETLQAPTQQWKRNQYEIDHPKGTALGKTLYDLMGRNFSLEEVNRQLAHEVSGMTGPLDKTSREPTLAPELNHARIQSLKAAKRWLEEQSEKEGFLKKNIAPWKNWGKQTGWDLQQSPWVFTAFGDNHEITAYDVLYQPLTAVDNKIEMEVGQETTSTLPETSPTDKVVEVLKEGTSPIYPENPKSTQEPPTKAYKEGEALWGQTIPFDKAPLGDQIAAHTKALYGVEETIKTLTAMVKSLSTQEVVPDQLPAYKQALETLKYMPSSIPKIEGTNLVYPTLDEVYEADVKPKIFQTVLDGFEVPEEQKPAVQAAAKSLHLDEAPDEVQQIFKKAVENGAWVFTPEMLKNSFWEKYYDPKTGTIGIPWGLPGELNTTVWYRETTQIAKNNPTTAKLFSEWTTEVKHEGYTTVGKLIFEKHNPQAIKAYEAAQAVLDKYYPDDDYIPVYYGHAKGETPFWLLGQNTKQLVSSTHKYLNGGLSPKIAHSFGAYDAVPGDPINSILFVPKKNIYGFNHTHAVEKELFFSLDGVHYAGELPKGIDEWITNLHNPTAEKEVLVGDKLHLFDYQSGSGESPKFQYTLPGMLPEALYLHKEKTKTGTSEPSQGIISKDWLSGDMFAGETHKILLDFWEQQVKKLKNPSPLGVKQTIGTTPGSGFITYKNGTTVYVKPLSGDRFLQGFTEYVANRLYGLLGRNVLLQGIKISKGQEPPTAWLISKVQKLTEINKKSWKELSEAQKLEVYKGFVADAWLANWDGLDTGIKNLQLDEEGRPIRTDNGGTLLFRAQGEEKLSFGASVDELKTLKDPKISPSAWLFEDMPAKAELAGARELAELDDSIIIETIADAAKKSGVSAAYRNKVTKILLARKQFIMEHYGLAMSSSVKAPVKAKIAGISLQHLTDAAAPFPFMMATVWYPHVNRFWAGKTVSQVIDLGGNLNQQLQAHLDASKFFSSSEQAKILLDMARFNWFHKWGQSVLANLDANSHIPPAAVFRGGLEKMATARSDLTSSFDQLMQRIYNEVPRNEMRGLGEYLRETGNHTYLKDGEELRWPSSLEKQKMAQRWDISAKSIDVAEAIQGRFLKALDEMQEVWENMAKDRLGDDPSKLATKLAEIKETMDKYRKAPYFPAARFGDYGLTVKAVNSDGTFATHAFYSGSKKEMEVLRNKLWTVFPEGLYSIGIVKMLTEEQQLYRGMPKEFLLDTLQEDLANAGHPLTPEQKSLIEEIALESLPVKSILQHYRPKKYLEGASDDWVRQIANYGTRHASHISKLVSNPIMDKALKDLEQWRKDAHNILGANKTTSEEMTGKLDQVGNLLSDLKQLRNYLATPGQDFADVKAMIHFFTLAFSPAQMLQEMSSLPLVAAPQLGATFGYSRATKEILNALTQPTKEMRYGGLGKADPGLTKALDKAIADQLLLESQTSEAVAIANGNLMSRSLPGGWGMRAWRNAQWVGSYLQRTGSTFSRDVTFRAAFRLTREALGDYQNLWSKTKGWIDHVAQVHGELIKELIMEQHWSHEDAIAYAAAKEVVENSHGNFQKMYRAASLRGGMRSLVLLYKNFAMQRLWSLNPLAHPDYVSVSQDPVTGAWLKKSTTNPLREASYVALASQAFAAGLLGLPGADLLKKLLDLALKYEAVTSRTGGTGKTADELFKTYLSGFDLPISANSLLYGMSHSLGGLFDLSSSLSLGNIVPGDPGDVAQVLSGKLPLSGIEALGRIGKDFGGVGASWIYNLVDTLQNDNPDWAKKLSEVAPHFSRGPLVTASAVRTGMETTLQGTPLISYDLTQPTAWAELTGRALGFTPTRLSEARAARTMQNAAEQYWTVREHEILQLYGRAFLAKDKELEKEASAAWDRMYDQVPAEFLRHLPKSSTIKESVKNYVLKHGSADYIPKAEVLAQEHYKEIEKAASLPHGGKVIQERVPGGR